MKKIVLFVALIFSGVVLANDSKPVLEKVGKKVRATYYYSNGQIRQEGFFVNGKLDGRWISYDENGNKIAKGEYSQGVKTGNWVFYATNLVKNNSSEVAFSNNKIEKVTSISTNAIALE